MCPSVPWHFSSQVLELNSTPLEQKDSLDWMNPADEQNMGGMIMCDFWSESHSLVSNSLPPHGLYSPWNSSGQNTGEYRPFPSPGDLPNPGIEPRSPALEANSLPTEPQGKPSDRRARYYFKGLNVVYILPNKCELWQVTLHFIFYNFSPISEFLKVF